MKSVLFISPSAYPLGGVAVWLDYLTHGLSSECWNVYTGLVTGHYHDINTYNSAYPRLKPLPIANPTGSREGRIRALLRTMEELQPDIVIAINIVDVYPAVQRARLKGQSVKVVMALHGISADLLKDARKYCAVLDGVITTNRLAVQLCIAYAGLSPDRILYAPCGVDTELLTELQQRSSSDVLQIAWVGRLEQTQKRVFDLPAILRELDRLGVVYHFKLAGDGPDRDELLKQLSTWIENGQIEYLGSLAPSLIAEKVYSVSDVLLLTSEWETGPIVAWEAMASGCAIVSSQYVGSGLESALLNNQNSLLFPIGDTSTAAHLIATLVSSDGLMSALTESARYLVKSRYSLQASVRQWATSLDNIAALPALQVPPKYFVPTAAGRLDRILGSGLAESLRSSLHIQFEHASAGGEWPHTDSSNADETELLELAARLDNGFHT